MNDVSSFTSHEKGKITKSLPAGFVSAWGKHKGKAVRWAVVIKQGAAVSCALVKNKRKGDDHFTISVRSDAYVYSATGTKCETLLEAIAEMNKILKRSPIIFTPNEVKQVEKAVGKDLKTNRISGNDKNGEMIEITTIFLGNQSSFIRKHGDNNFTVIYQFSSMHARKGKIVRGEVIKEEQSENLNLKDAITQAMAFWKTDEESQLLPGQTLMLEPVMDEDSSMPFPESKPDVSEGMKEHFRGLLSAITPPHPQGQEMAKGMLPPTRHAGVYVEITPLSENIVLKGIGDNLYEVAIQVDGRNQNVYVSAFIGAFDEELAKRGLTEQGLIPLIVKVERRGRYVYGSYVLCGSPKLIHFGVCEADGTAEALEYFKRRIGHYFMYGETPSSLMERSKGWQPEKKKKK